MKPEKELKWLSGLYNSKSCSYPIKFKINPSILCKKDFERIVGSSLNNKEFSVWFDRLINNVFIYSGIIKNRRVKDTKGYIVNGSNLIKYAKTNPQWNITYKLFNYNRTI
jgi:hypothetical protein